MDSTYDCDKPLEKPIEAPYGDVFKAAKWSWPCGDGIAHRETDIVDGCLYLQSDGNGRRMESLPTEFFSHELLDIDPLDADSVADFTASFGFLFHPMRYSASTHLSLFDREIVCGEYGIATTDYLQDFGFEKPIHPAVESLQEATFSLIFLQRQARTLHQLILTGNVAWGAEFELTTFLNNVSSGNYFAPGISRTEEDSDHGSFKWHVGHESAIETKTFVFLDETGIQRAQKEFEQLPHSDNEVSPLTERAAETRLMPLSLTNAIANQMLDVLASDAPWYVCPECGKPYKHQHADVRKVKNPSKQRGFSKYCSDSCREKAKSRRHRKKVKAAKQADRARKGES